VRFLILSDVHANWDALQAVLRHVKRKRYDRIAFLGDAVGYGASPNAVLNWLHGLGPSAAIVRGNHDRVCSGLDRGDYFNRYAREASSWTYERLDERNLEFLRSFPEGPMELDPEVAICHGSSIDEDAYIFSVYDAQQAFESLPHRVIFFGHTHVPTLFTLRSVDGQQSLQARLLSGRRSVVTLEPDARYLVNPGSVGQPRDRDPGAAYALYDQTGGRLYLYRVPYRVAIARRRIIQAGLPAVLGDRLLHGA
jgi:predicted phosphodiesterase